MICQTKFMFNICSARRYITGHEADTDRQGGPCTSDAVCLYQEGVCLPC